MVADDGTKPDARDVATLWNAEPPYLSEADAQRFVKKIMRPEPHSEETTPGASQKTPDIGFTIAYLEDAKARVIGPEREGIEQLIAELRQGTNQQTTIKPLIQWNGKLETVDGWKYPVLESLGQGGQGHAKLVELPNGDEIVDKGSHFDQRTISSIDFERHLNIVVPLRHPNLPRVFGGYLRRERNQRDESIYPHTLMQYVPGENLDTIMHRESIKREFLVHVTQDIAGVLAYLHEQNLIHRDVRPANIQIGDVAHLLDPQKITEVGDNLSHYHLSMTAMTNDTYRAPELDIGDNTPAADVRSFTHSLLNASRTVRDTSVRGPSTKHFHASHYQNAERTEIVATSAFDAQTIDFLISCLNGNYGERPQNAARFMEGFDRSRGIGVAVQTTTQSLEARTNAPRTRTNLKPNLNVLPQYLRDEVDFALKPYIMTGRRVEDDMRTLIKEAHGVENSRAFDECAAAMERIIPSFDFDDTHDAVPAETFIFNHTYPVKVRQALREDKDKYKQTLLREAREIDRQLRKAGLASDDPKVLREHGVMYETQFAQIRGRKSGLGSIEYREAISELEKSAGTAGRWRNNAWPYISPGGVAMVGVATMASPVSLGLPGGWDAGAKIAGTIVATILAYKGGAFMRDRETRNQLREADKKYEQAKTLLSPQPLEARVNTVTSLREDVQRYRQYAPNVIERAEKGISVEQQVYDLAKRKSARLFFKGLHEYNADVRELGRIIDDTTGLEKRKRTTLESMALLGLIGGGGVVLQQGLKGVLPALGITLIGAFIDDAVDGADKIQGKYCAHAIQEARSIDEKLRKAGVLIEDISKRPYCRPREHVRRVIEATPNAFAPESAYERFDEDVKHLSWHIPQAERLSRARFINVFEAATPYLAAAAAGAGFGQHTGLAWTLAGIGCLGAAAYYARKKNEGEVIKKAETMNCFPISVGRSG